MGTAQRMVDEAAKEWGAYQENGIPRAFYHATNATFTAFNKGERTGLSGKGIYFGYSRMPYGDKTLKCYLKMENPISYKDTYKIDGVREVINGQPQRIVSDFYDKFPQYDGVLGRDEVTVKKSFSNQIRRHCYL